MKTAIIVAVLAGAGYWFYLQQQAKAPRAAADYSASDRKPSDTTPGANAAARMDNLTGQAPP